MSRVTLRIALLYGLGAIAVLAPLVAAMWLSQRQSLRHEEDRAGAIAAQLLHRTSDIVRQLNQVLTQLGGAPSGAACSDQNITLMRALVVRSNLLIDVGYVKDNDLVCSAFGRNAVPIGPPTYLSKNGYMVRVGLRHPLAPDTNVIIVTDPRTGFAGIVSQELLIDMVPDETDLVAGMIGVHSGIVLAQRGAFISRWRGRIGKSDQVTFYDGAYVVAWRRSERGDYAAFAAIGRRRIEQGRREFLLILMPIGSSAALLLFFVVLRLARLQASVLGLLRSALKTRREFFLVYQPIVDLRTGEWCGAEALLRWRRPNGEVIGPEIFIPIAERNQLMEQITTTLLHILAAEAGELLRRKPEFHIALNLCADDFCRPDIVERLRATMQKMQIAPHNLQVEATERVFLDTAVCSKNLQLLRDEGIKVTIDDFGSGYSSLSYLNSLDVDGLKIDKAFIDTIGTQAVTREVIRHIIEMAKSLQLVMVAEGVETQVQLDFLRAQGVQYGQGWLFAKPMAMDQLLHDERLNH